MKDEPDLIPTTAEIINAVLFAERHCFHKMHYSESLQCGLNDPQNPHDLVGFGNKLEWEVLSGLAFQIRREEEGYFTIFKKYVKPAIERHRLYQYHHQKWNEPNDNATDDDMKSGAIDFVCSILENRPYNKPIENGYNPFIDVKEKIEEAKGVEKYKHQIKWMEKMVLSMEELPLFPLYKINSIYVTPKNPGVSNETYDKIIALTHECIEILKRDHNYTDL